MTALIRFLAAGSMRGPFLSISVTESEYVATLAAWPTCAMPALPADVLAGVDAALAVLS